MALVDDILNHLKTTYKPAAGEFLQFDQQRLVDKFKLRQQGRERGLKEQPASDLLDLDVVEQNIVEAMRRQAVEDERRTRQQYEYYRDRLKSANPAGLAQSMVMEAGSAVAKFRSAMLSYRAILSANWRALEDRKRQLHDFQAVNDIARPPHPPKSHWLMIASLLFCLVVETAVNAGVLSAGSDYGILGGIVSAAFYTASSMMLAFILGMFCLTGLVHRRWSRKIFSGLLVIALLAAIAGINLLAAHYRVAITAGIGEIEAAKQAAVSMFRDWSLFTTDTQSILMIVFSLAVAFVAGAEGYFWQDPYPGYARVGKFVRSAEAKWIRSIEEVSSELDDIYSVYSEKIKELRVDLARRQASIPIDLGNRRRLVVNFNTHLGHIQDVGNFLLENYREANCETRKTPKPGYFRTRWQLESVRPMEMPDDQDVGDVNAWDSVGKSLLSAAAELNAAHEAAVRWIDGLASGNSPSAGLQLPAAASEAVGGIQVSDVMDEVDILMDRSSAGSSEDAAGAEKESPETRAAGGDGRADGERKARRKTQRKEVENSRRRRGIKKETLSLDASGDGAVVGSGEGRSGHGEA